MRNPENNLREDVKQCLSDPVFDIIKNFSLQKSRKYYSKWEEAWEKWCYTNNPAAKKEAEEFEYKWLDELERASREARVFFYNIREKATYFKNVSRELEYDKIVVRRVRLKTFDEWLHDGLKDALIMATDCPEDGARKILEKEIGSSMFTNSAIHLFIEWKINKEVLERLGTYERYQPIIGRDMEKDIEEAKKALKDIEECNNKDVTVLTLKI